MSFVILYPSRLIPFQRISRSVRLQRYFASSLAKSKKEQNSSKPIENGLENGNQSINLLRKSTLDVVSMTPATLERLVAARQYLTASSPDSNVVQFQFSPEFIRVLISWCSSKYTDVLQNRFDAIEASVCIANILRSMKTTLIELKKKKPPRKECLDEMSRLYALGLQKLRNGDTIKSDPAMVNRILTYYADACCNFEYDPSAPDVDVWPPWFEIAKRWLEEVDSAATWNVESSNVSAEDEFTKANAYLLSLIIDVTLRFKRIADFKALQSPWESRIGVYIANLKERNQYVISLRMATLLRQHGVEFKDVVAARLSKTGIQRSFNEYQFRKGLGTKPTRSVAGKLKENQ